MDVRKLPIEGVVEIVPQRFSDSRGFFAETYARGRFAEAGIGMEWVQDNQSYSADKGVLRGLHFQVGPFAQDKLVRVLKGAIFDVAVDLRRGSGSYGKWVACEVSAAKFNQVLVPRGFAHGFLTLEPDTEVLYKVSAPYARHCDRNIRWNDPQIGIAWPLAKGVRPILSDKDAQAPLLAEAGDIQFDAAGD